MQVRLGSLRVKRRKEWIQTFVSTNTSAFMHLFALVPRTDGADARNVFVDDLGLAGVSDATNAGDGYVQLFAGVHLGLSGAAEVHLSLGTAQFMRVDQAGARVANLDCLRLALRLDFCRAG